jgi:hypothetical protein
MFSRRVHRSRCPGSERPGRLTEDRNSTLDGSRMRGKTTKTMEISHPGTPTSTKACRPSASSASAISNPVKVGNEQWGSQHTWGLDKAAGM